ncbi:hypothetical protein [Nocardia sp. NPDC048505]|uniref:hypothetical protein n=1 Tax=unclassified Nocardia TaxID=2637762 RepID=UPI0033DECE88
MEQPRVRVAAYVIRDRGGAELLVFDHVGMPEAGTQVPADGVEAGESLACRFEALPLSTPLADHQDAWLDARGGADRRR